MLLGLLGALWLTLALPAEEAGQSAGGGPDEQCLACHGQEGMQGESGRSVYVDAGKFKNSVHSGLGCNSCHTAIKDYPHPRQIPKMDCATCHGETVRDFRASVHGMALSNSVADSPTCQSCHGSPHAIVPARDLPSPDRKSTRLNSSHIQKSRMPSSA